MSDIDIDPLDNNDIVNLGNLSSMRDDITKLSNASNLLVNGASNLSNGVSKLKDWYEIWRYN